MCGGSPRQRQRRREKSETAGRRSTEDRTEHGGKRWGRRRAPAPVRLVDDAERHLGAAGEDDVVEARLGEGRVPTGGAASATLNRERAPPDGDSGSGGGLTVRPGREGLDSKERRARASEPSFPVTVTPFESLTTFATAVSAARQGAQQGRRVSLRARQVEPQCVLGAVQEQPAQGSPDPWITLRRS